MDWDHPVVLTQDDIENAQKKQESTYGDQPLRRDTVRWDSPVVLSAEDIEEAQKLKSAAKDNPLRDTVRWDSPVVLSGEDIEGAQKLKAAATDNPLRDTVRWDSPLVLKAEDFELITPVGFFLNGLQSDFRDFSTLLADHLFYSEAAKERH